MATDEAVRQLQNEVEELKQALVHYTSCRHAMQFCRCTNEARAALYPYVVKEKEGEASK
jgi:hypothetical protein